MDVPKLVDAPKPVPKTTLKELASLREALLSVWVRVGLWQIYLSAGASLRENFISLLLTEFHPVRLNCDQTA
jgi:hypothetical protein